jgi:hypothetical protein
MASCDCTNGSANCCADHKQLAGLVQAQLQLGHEPLIRIVQVQT